MIFWRMDVVMMNRTTQLYIRKDSCFLLFLKIEIVGNGKSRAGLVAVLHLLVTFAI